MFVRTVKRTYKPLNILAIGKRFNSHGSPGHGDHEIPTKETEVNLFKVFSISILGAISYILYKNHKNGDEPIFKTKSYNQVETRGNQRTENYLKRYETSFIKGYIRDKGGIGQKQYKRMSEGPISTVLIPTHSTGGDQFGAGIKLGNLGPRKEPIRYFAPLKQ